MSNPQFPNLLWGFRARGVQVVARITPPHCSHHFEEGTERLFWISGLRLRLLRIPVADWHRRRIANCAERERNGRG